MSLPRFAKLDPDRQSGILTAAGTEFAAEGFGGASFNRIIAEAGLSKGAMYYYFADKDDLYQTVVEGVGARVLELMRGPDHVDCGQGYWDTWRQIYRNVFGHLAEHTADAAILWDAISARARGSGHPTLEGMAHRLFERVRALVVLGQETGAVRTDLPEALLLHAVFGMLEGVDRWFAEQWAAGNAGDEERMAELAVELLQRLAAPTGQVSA